MPPSGIVFPTADMRLSTCGISQFLHFLARYSTFHGESAFEDDDVEWAGWIGSLPWFWGSPIS